MPIVIARYSIPVFPLSYIFVAIGLDGILRKLQRIFLMSHSTKNKLQGKRLVITHACSSMSCNLIPVFFFIVLFAMGPLPRVYSSPNNFTNHSAFQESYKPLTWKESYPSHVDTNPMIEESEIPLFYRRLSQDLNKYIIIEYPMDIADASNLLYYYQHIHKKRIMAGYVLQSVVAGYIEMHGIPTTTLTRFTYEYIDERLENVDSKKLNFRNMINMVNIDAIKASQARYIVLHKDVQHVQNDSSTDATVMVYKPILYLQELYQKFWGIPVFEDRNIIVFKIPK